jgi:hypothetical protein
MAMSPLAPGILKTQSKPVVASMASETFALLN